MAKVTTFNPVKLLPGTMRPTTWADWVNVFYELTYTDLKTDKIDPIITTYFKDSLTTEYARIMAYEFGFELSEGEGYTATIGYLQKEIETIIKRIQTKTNRAAYLYEYFIFLLWGDVYPLIKSNDASYLYPYLTWFTDPYLNDLESLTLDYDTPWTLDEGFYLDEYDILGLLTRHTLLRYEHRFLEDTGIFHSVNTAKAFFNDIFQIKRAVEIPHFEPNIFISTPPNQVLATKTFTDDVDKTTTDDQESICLTVTGALDTVDKIRFGTGGHATVDGSITDVETFVYEYDISEFNIDSQSATQFYAGIKLTESARLFGNDGSLDHSVSEVILFDSGSNPLVYSKFPKINFYRKMLSSIYLSIDIT